MLQRIEKQGDQPLKRHHVQLVVQLLHMLDHLQLRLHYDLLKDLLVNQNPQQVRVVVQRQNVLGDRYEEPKGVLFFLAIL